MGKKSLFIAFAFFVFIWGGVAFAQSAPVGEYVEGEVLVVLEGTGINASDVSSFKAGLDSSAKALASSVGAKSVGTYSAIAAQSGKSIAHLRAEGKTTAELMEELKAQPGVVGVAPNYIFRISSWSNDPMSGDLWGMADIKAPEAWGLCSGDKGVFVAVIDTGIDYNHQDIKENIGRDLDGELGIDTVSNDRDPMDDNDHGTHVAGTIGAVGNNGIGVTGINWGVSLLAVKVLNREGSGTGDQIVAGLDYVVGQKRRGLNIRVANMSLGGWGLPINNPDSDPYASAFKAVTNAGILLVVAAGNEGQNIDNPTGYRDREDKWIDLRGLAVYPACFKFTNMITVGAISADHTQAYFSNHSPNYVHIAAPGVSILSTVSNDSYQRFGGTSMATPHVAGVAALIAAYRPNLSAGEIKGRILANVTDNSVLAGSVATRGNLNLYDALRGAKSDVKVTSITVPSSQKVLDIDAGTSVALSPTVSPSNATNKVLVWSSSNNFAATVSGSGVVKGRYSGTATIYASSNDGSNVSDSVTVNVTGGSLFGDGGGCSIGLAPATLLLALPLLFLRR
ncbi:S8 family serine peptidase [Dethiosulfovibrio salsuginis]|uniref:Synergist-CTERM protein sorting domain-containing protein n=1 Tax=Dethiosulfovibrio salsuginis TaxID=561720 RepID=A0A1X7K6P9_9BACT|nr:S8 family serine peptidase [Dethiosulfovibrio salsuginis]SMG36707.1 Synergist-CTERM protein sorting domain-containing protein [Dethiosulfovibrio salsuginis]